MHSFPVCLFWTYKDVVICVMENLLISCLPLLGLGGLCNGKSAHFLFAFALNCNDVVIYVMESLLISFVPLLGPTMML